ncbi:MAG TPA: TetR/AcrR family transcriptional regulator, partial [Acidimicrobiales bacterium]|nr:TetR/AcrR family transcriptional regulator [Acidimicrobiales bacterium]
SMRDLASRAGITTPTVYAYFGSKNDIYDAMFGQAAADFAARMAAPYPDEGPRENLVAGARRFVGFCAEDVARYQLLFQRTIPGFEPSPESYAYAVEALEDARRRLADNGITEPRHVDMWTALVTGLVDQQISNDPGGERWIGLIGETVDMFLAHCLQAPRRTSRNPSRGTTTSPRKGASK